MENSDKLRTATILLYTTVALALFICFGSADFYKNNISAGETIDARYYYFFSSFILLAIIPILIWLLGFKLTFAEMGIARGKLKNSLIVILAGLPVIILISYFTARNPAFRMEYPLYRVLVTDQSSALAYWAMYGFYYFGWEVLFRGFMLFGLKNDFGELNSILIQTMPSCLAHIGKPDLELLSSIPAGIIFGWIALRCRSVWPVFILHWCLGVSLDLFIVYG